MGRTLPCYQEIYSGLLITSPEKRSEVIIEMMWFKACPRCSGDLYSEKDTYGPYLACLQCGHDLTVAEEARVTSSMAMREPRPLVPVQAQRPAA